MFPWTSECHQKSVSSARNILRGIDMGIWRDTKSQSLENVDRVKMIGVTKREIFLRKAFFLEHSTDASALKAKMHIIEDVHRDQQINKCVIEMIVLEVVRRGTRIVTSIASVEKVHRDH